MKKSQSKGALLLGASSTTSFNVPPPLSSRYQSTAIPTVEPNKNRPVMKPLNLSFTLKQEVNMMNTIVAESWRKAKKDKQASKPSHNNSVIHSTSKEDDGFDLQAIMDAAWVQKRDTVFRKKRNTIGGKTSARGGGAGETSGSNAQKHLEEIDENEEAHQRLIEVENIDPTLDTSSQEHSQSVFNNTASVAMMGLIT